MSVDTVDEHQVAEFSRHAEAVDDRVRRRIVGDIDLRLG
jgi:hypothetical protein